MCKTEHLTWYPIEQNIYKILVLNIIGGSFMGGNFTGDNLPGGKYLGDIIHAAIFRVEIFLIIYIYITCPKFQMDIL